MRKFLLFSFVFLFVSCAVVPKPTTQNPAKVTMNFRSVVYGFNKEKSVLTYWRKINADGSMGERFAIGGANAFNRAINTSRFRKPRDEVVLLDSGEYFLDSFEIETKNQIALSMPGDYTKRNGFDEVKKEPLFLSFKVKENENLVLPKVIFILDGNKFYADIEGNNGIFKIGPKLNLDSSVLQSKRFKGEE